MIQDAFKIGGVPAIGLKFGAGLTKETEKAIFKNSTPLVLDKTKKVGIGIVDKLIIGGIIAIIGSALVRALAK